jgi:translation initiation factor IF-3
MRKPHSPHNKFRVTSNDQIRYKEVRVIAREQESVVMATKDALNSARNQGLDLILINDKANPPLCRIVEMNKYLYEQKQKEKAEKKRQRENLTDQKEIRMGLNIDVHDLQTKANHAKKFLEQKAKVTVTIVLKGRERGKQDMARDLLNSFAELLEAEYETINSQNNRVIGRVK